MSLAATTSDTASAMSTVDFIRLLRADDSQIDLLELSLFGFAVQLHTLDRKIVTFGDPNQCEQIGREMGSSTKLWKLRWIEPYDIDTLPTESKQSLKRFYEGLEHNSSIQDLTLCFQRDDFSIFDWEHFMTYNTQIKQCQYRPLGHCCQNKEGPLS